MTNLHYQRKSETYFFRKITVFAIRARFANEYFALHSDGKTNFYDIMPWKQMFSNYLSNFKMFVFGVFDLQLCYKLICMYLVYGYNIWLISNVLLIISSNCAYKPQPTCSRMHNIVFPIFSSLVPCGTCENTQLRA